MEKINKIKSWLFKKIDKSLAMLTKNKKQRQIVIFHNETDDITTEPTDIKG